MLSLGTITKLLGYANSEHFRTKESDFELETVQHFRVAKKRPNGAFKVNGFYVFRTGKEADQCLPARPAVCVADARTADDARRLHRRIWNLGNVPFLIVRLPNEIRVYSGFSYKDNEEAGLILTETSETKSRILASLSDFTSQSIDSAHIWEARKDNLKTRERVNTTLLHNLSELADALTQVHRPHLMLHVAHALIGKFVYLRYLRDRNILDDDWLAKHHIEIERIFGPLATLNELVRLDEALESRFNGKVFHIDFKRDGVLNDSHVQLVASVFAGDKIHTSERGFVQQLHFRFKAYDFRHIPVETLSSIYEQFLHGQKKGRKDGAFYTPEVLADYLLSEIGAVSKLKLGMKILDPACGSGVFLVLAYRRLIESELSATGKRPGDIEPMRLRDILVRSIYGVERQPDACNVTIFSLILTLLHYVDPPALHANARFKFPALLNTRIFCDDFFNPKLKLKVPKGGFDVIVGNPPWVELKPDTIGEENARAWIESEPSISGNRVADAFAVKAGRLMAKSGTAGLLLPASTLLTLEGKRFRINFFTEFSVSRIANLANLRGNLFGGRAILPAATFVFQKATEERLASPILHCGPFAVDQVAGDATELWTITIHGTDVQPVSQKQAATGDTSVWKLALWGTQRDVRALQELQNLYPLTLTDFCRERGWGDRLPREGAQLRHVAAMKGTVPVSSESEELLYCDELIGKLRFDVEKFNSSAQNEILQFSIPDGALVKIPDDYCYIRKRGGLSGLDVNKPPHLLIPAAWKNFLLFSEDYFAVPPRQMAISCSEKDADVLRALTVYLGSSLVDYFVFFNVPEWGIYSTMSRVVQRVIRAIPTPNFTQEQVDELAKLHRELVKSETTFRLRGPEPISSDEKQRNIDNSVFQMLELPEHLQVILDDFRDARLPLDRGAAALAELGRKPLEQELRTYGRILREELNRFLMGEGEATVSLLHSQDLICCEVKLNTHSKSASIIVQDASSTPKRQEVLRTIRQMLTEKFSQWIYLQRRLIVRGDDLIQLFKPPRVMDWTRTRALSDADSIIADILSNTEPA